VASILFLVLGIFALVLSLNSASTLVEAALCVAGIFALWGPASSQAHFAGEVEAESSAGMRWRSPSGAMSSTAVPATGSRATSATVAAVIAVAAFVGGASNAFASNPYNSAFTVPLTTRTTTPVALPARSSRCPRAWDDPGKRLKARKA
jgi:hypothetical protein